MSINHYNHCYYPPILVLKHWNKSDYLKTLFSHGTWDNFKSVRLHTHMHM